MLQALPAPLCRLVIDQPEFGLEAEVGGRVLFRGLSACWHDAGYAIRPQKDKAKPAFKAILSISLKTRVSAGTIPPTPREDVLQVFKISSRTALARLTASTSSRRASERKLPPSPAGLWWTRRGCQWLLFPQPLGDKLGKIVKADLVEVQVELPAYLGQFSPEQLVALVDCFVARIERTIYKNTARVL